MNIIKALRGICASDARARRLVNQGAIRVDGETIRDIEFEIPSGEHEIGTKHHMQSVIIMD